MGTIKLLQGSRVQERELLEAGGAGGQACAARICNAVYVCYTAKPTTTQCVRTALTHTNTQHSASRRLVSGWLSHRAPGILQEGKGYPKERFSQREGVCLIGGLSHRRLSYRRLFQRRLPHRRLARGRLSHRKLSQSQERQSRLASLQVQGDGMSPRVSSCSASRHATACLSQILCRITTKL